MYKKILPLLFFFTGLTLTTTAQDLTADEVNDLFWGEEDNYKTAKNTPDKWNNKDAVIIYQQYKYHYTKTYLHIDYLESIRQRIKLNSQTAVDKYQNFSFPELLRISDEYKAFEKGKMYMALKVIKANGSESKVDLKELSDVKLSEGIPVFKDIKIQNLAVGDIIDCYYYVYEPLHYSSYYNFKPIVTSFGDNYPVMKHDLIMEVGKDFYINSKSLHGVPQLNIEENKKRKLTVYQISDSNREGFNKEPFLYPRRSLPTINLHVSLGKIDSKENINIEFTGKKGLIKKSLEKDDILKAYNFEEFEYSNSGLNKYLKEKNLSNSKSKIKLIETAYYYLRHHEVILKKEPLTLLENGIVKSISDQYKSFPTDDTFIYKFGSFLKDHKIDFDIILAVPKSVSSIENLIIKNDAVLMVKINLKTPLFVSNAGVHTNYNDIPADIEGTEAYILDVSEDFEVNLISPITLPESTKDDNKTIVRTNMSFNKENLSEIIFNREKVFSGHSKEEAQKELIGLYNYVPRENRIYGTSNYLERSNTFGKSKTNLKSGISSFRKKDRNAQKEAFKKTVEKDFDTKVKMYDIYTIVSQGRTVNKQSFSYNEKFRISELMEKKGQKDFTLAVGKLLGSPFNFREKNLNRKADIYMPYAQTYEHTITINLPTTYGTREHNELKMKTENETGGFIATVTPELNKLTITTTIYFNNNIEKAEKWGKMVEILDSIKAFTEKTITIHKKY